MRSEELEQKAFVEYLRVLERQGKIIAFFAPMNEDKLAFANRKRAFLVEQKAKAMGKRAGVSDLVIIAKEMVVFMEMKRKPKKLKSGRLSYSGIKVSENQKRFLNAVNKSDVCVGVVVYGFEDAKNKLLNILSKA